MTKLRRRCLHCGKVGDIKYQWGTTNPNDDIAYFCSEECALECFTGASATKCAHCGKPLSDGNSVYIRARGYTPSNKVYCSAKCFLADQDCIPIEEVNQDKKDSHEVD